MIQVLSEQALRPINWTVVLSGSPNGEEMSNFQRYKSLAAGLLIGASIALLDAAVRKLKR